MKKLLFFLLFPLCVSAQTTTTLSKLKAGTGTSLNTVYKIGTRLYQGTTDKVSIGNDSTIIVNKRGTRYYRLTFEVPVPVVKPIEPTPTPTTTEKTVVAFRDKEFDNPVFNEDMSAAMTYETLPYNYIGTDTARDMNVLLNASQWEVYLRYVDTVDNGRAIVVQGQGTWVQRVGVVQNLKDPAKMLRTLYYYDCCVNTLPPSGDSLRIELSFVDIKITVDGKPYITLQEKDHLYSGSVRIKLAPRPQTVKDLAITYKKRKPTLSDSDKRIFDGEDFDIKELHTIGSIDSNSNALRVAKGTAKLFKVNQMVFIEAGYTRGFEGRKSGSMGTIDAGGSSPSEWIAEASMLKGIIRNDGYTIADKKTGIRWYTNGKGDWAQMSQNGNGMNTGFYSFMAVPKAFIDTIKSIDTVNDIIYFHTKAKAQVTNAPVYLDGVWPINRLTGHAANRFFGPYPRPYKEGATYENSVRNLEAIKKPFKLRLRGKIAISEQVNVMDKDDIEIFADDTATLYSPNGVSTASVFSQFCNRLQWKNIGLQGNVLDSSFTPVVYQFNYGTGGPVTGQTLSDYVFNFFPETYTSGFNLGNAKDMKFENVTLSDGFTAGLQTQNLKDSKFSNIHYKKKFGLRTYGGWPFGFNSGSHSDTLENFTIETPSVSGGFEAFNSDSCVFIRGRLVNATAAVNSGRSVVMEDIDIIMKTGAMGLYYNENPGLNLNLNAYAGAVSGGGRIKNFNIHIEGPLDNNTLAMKGYVVQANVKNVVFDNCTYTLGHGFLGKGKLTRAIGFSSDGDNITLRNFTANVPVDYDIRNYGWAEAMVLMASNTGAILNSKGPAAFYDPAKVRFESPGIKYRWTFVGGGIYINGKIPTIPLENMNLDNL